MILKSIIYVLINKIISSIRIIKSEISLVNSTDTLSDKKYLVTFILDILPKKIQTYLANCIWTADV